MDRRVRIVDAEFLRAWWNLRTHILDYELSYFFELTNPVLSLEIVFVLTVLAVSIIAVFVNDYDGDGSALSKFMAQLVTKSNVLMILLLFFVCVCITLLVRLYNLLRPYDEQMAHEAWADRMLIMLKFEQAKKLENVAAERTEYDATMELLGTLKEQMHAIKAVPTLLGVFELNATRIQSILSVIVLPITAFAITFVQGTFEEIRENAGL